MAFGAAKRATADLLEFHGLKASSNPLEVSVKPLLLKWALEAAKSKAAISLKSFSESFLLEMAFGAG
ncbi:hypothetical protein GOBAR_AA37581 [Gossypium barbadense]|uniref:Uncharacterized protein n=1 Tax=Gossypium barbadense TaxID=3634 RepID=A0A2P5VWC6_GOSBA|nr:hypothetical protein GOBAR_AA37581 [Gossypium barbadense]